MKTLITILFLLIAIPAWALPPFMTGLLQKGGTTCTQWIVQTSTNSITYVGATNDSQKVKNIASNEVCSVKFKLDNQSTSCSVHIELWSDVARAGTQYGSDSGNTVIVNGGEAWYTFTFTAPYPTPTGDFYTHIVNTDCAGITNIRTSIHTTNTTYEDTNYDLNRNGTDLNYDAGFEIWRMQ